MAFTLNAWPRNGYRMSRATLRKAMGASPLYRFLEMLATQDVYFLKDDFDRKAIDTTNLWTVANGGGAGISSFAINTQANGVVRATTGTGNGDTSTCTLIGLSPVYGANNPWIEIRWKPITLVTETRIELGFVDVVPGSTKSVVNNLTTPTVNTSVVEAAVYAYDHTGTTTTNELVTIGSAVAAAKTTFTPRTAIAATTFNVVRISINSAGRVEMWMDGINIGLHNTGAACVAGTVALYPFALIRASDANSKSLDLDYIMVGADRV